MKYVKSIFESNTIHFEDPVWNSTTAEDLKHMIFSAKTAEKNLNLSPFVRRGNGLGFHTTGDPIGNGNSLEIQGEWVHTGNGLGFPDMGAALMNYHVGVFGNPC